MMELVAGAGGMFGQLAVGLAGGMDSQEMNIASKMQAFARTKSTVDSLPDKVRTTIGCLNLIHMFKILNL